MPNATRLSVATMPAQSPIEAKPQAAPEAAKAPPPKQGVLFGPGRDPLRVVERVVQMPASQARKDAVGRAAAVRSSPPRHNQQRLFNSTAPLDALIPDSTIYCDAPVAMPVHRLMAAALDGSMVLISMGVFLAIFYMAGGKVVLTKTTFPLYAAAMIATLTIYRCLWCMANTDSIGMRWSGLMLVTFDGTAPESRHRWQRVAASYISAIAGGLGILWCLVDEEKLTWHDHMSKTFPTPRAKVLKYPNH